MIPKHIKLHQHAQELELIYSAQEIFHLSAEFLRVLSPSAEVRGHGTPVLQIGKKHVRIEKVEPVGKYAIKLTFDDGHDSGLYSWEYLRELCNNQDAYWDEYLKALHMAGKSREPHVAVVQLLDPHQPH